MMQDDPDMASPGAAAQTGAGVQANLRAFHAHWSEARRGEAVPYRAHIDPRRIAPLLPNAFVAERIAPGVTRLRIAGMNLSDLMGMEVRGMPLCSFLAPSARAGFALSLVDLFDRPATLRMGLRSAGGLGRPELRGTLLMLPLRSDLGDVSRALGCLVTTGAAGRTPRRFNILTTRITPVEEDTGAGALRLVAGGRAERTPTGATPSARGHLRLVPDA
jgi:hypothetical protein